MSGTMQFKHKSILLNTPPRNSQDSISWYILVLLTWWRVCIQDHKWWYCGFRKNPSKQGQAVCKEDGKFKDNCQAHQTSGWWPTSCEIQFNEAPACRAFIRKTQEEKRTFVKSRQLSHKNAGNENQHVSSHYKKSFHPKKAYKNKDRCSKCGDSTHVEGFQCPVKKFQCKICHKFGHFTSFAIKKTNSIQV